MKLSPPGDFGSRGTRHPLWQNLIVRNDTDSHLSLGLCLMAMCSSISLCCRMIVQMPYEQSEEVSLRIIRMSLVGRDHLVPTSLPWTRLIVLLVTHFPPQKLERRPMCSHVISRREQARTVWILQIQGMVESGEDRLYLVFLSSKRAYLKLEQTQYM